MRTIATVAALAIALTLAGASPAAVPPTLVPGEVTVALSLPSPGLQAGSVQGRTVVLSKGLEPELARAVAARLGIKRVRFVNEPLFSRLVAPGPKPWDFAIAAVTITKTRKARVSFTVPYLSADQGVLVRKGLAAIPTSIRMLRSLQLCSERATTGGQYIVKKIRPTKKPQLARTPTALFDLLRSGRCDAAVYDAPILGAAQQAAPDRYGPLAGRIKTGERYAIVVEKGNPLLRQLSRAVNTLVRNGTVARLSKRWLASDLARLRVLR